MTLVEPSAAPVGSPLAGFIFRPMALEPDLPRLARLYTEVDAVDQTGEARSVAEIRDELDVPGFDVTQDEWLVEAPGDSDRLIGEGFSFRVPSSHRAVVGVKIHPAWRRRGIGSPLLARALARARAQGAAYVTADVDSRLPGGGTFLAGHGFARVQMSAQLRTASDSPMAAPVVPAGYTVRPYTEVGDVAALTAAINRGFTGHWENRERAVDEVAHWLAAAHTRPAGIFLAFGPAGDRAGICWTSYNEDANARQGAQIGHIDRLGIVPGHRRHGLGRALLLTGMRWLRAQGQAILDLDVMGDNERALALYESVGFVCTKQTFIYRRELY